MMGFMDERERDFQRKRKIYWGKIYDDLHPWDTDGVKMKDKKPLVRVRLTKLAVDTANSYLFADAQGPALSRRTMTMSSPTASKSSA